MEKIHDKGLKSEYLDRRINALNCLEELMRCGEFPSLVIVSSPEGCGTPEPLFSFTVTEHMAVNFVADSYSKNHFGTLRYNKSGSPALKREFEFQWDWVKRLAGQRIDWPDDIRSSADLAQSITNLRAVTYASIRDIRRRLEQIQRRLRRAGWLKFLDDHVLAKVKEIGNTRVGSFSFLIIIISLFGDILVRLIPDGVFRYLALKIAGLFSIIG